VCHVRSGPAWFVGRSTRPLAVAEAQQAREGRGVMRYLLIAAAFYGVWRLALRLDRWLTEPSRLAKHAREYEAAEQRRVAVGYEWEG